MRIFVSNVSQQDDPLPFPSLDYGKEGGGPQTSQGPLLMPTMTAEDFTPQRPQQDPQEDDYSGQAAGSSNSDSSPLNLPGF